MIDKIRTLMLLIAVSVSGYAGYVFLSKFEATSENIDVRITKEGLDVEIKKFKVIHEKLGRKEWELKADIAEINQKNETTKMSNVEYIYINKKFEDYSPVGFKDYLNLIKVEGKELAHKQIHEINERVFLYTQHKLKEKYGPEEDDWFGRSVAFRIHPVRRRRISRPGQRRWGDAE